VSDALDSATVTQDPNTGVLALEAAPNESVLIEAALRVKRRTGSAPQAFIMGSAWRAFFDRLDVPRWAREKPVFLTGESGGVPMVFDDTLGAQRVVALPQRFGREPALTKAEPTVVPPRKGALEGLIEQAADGLENVCHELSGGVPAEEATWPPTAVNGSGRVTVGANTLGMAVNLSVMQQDHGTGRSFATKPVTQTAGFDPKVARSIAAQLVAAAEWVEAKQQ
jgi:hypothetical protein